MEAARTMLPVGAVTAARQDDISPLRAMIDRAEFQVNAKDILIASRHELRSCSQIHERQLDRVRDTQVWPACLLQNLWVSKNNKRGSRRVRTTDH